MSEQPKTAWAYLRMSSKSQDTSLEQQRVEILKLAQRDNLNITAWYSDEGKSASKDTEKRLAFHKLLSDAKKIKPGEVSFVLTWNTSRFSREDTIDGGFAKAILRDKGICLLTVKDGLIDWNTFAGRIQDSIFSELNHLYSQNLAADSLRGRIALLEAGYWPNGSAPYGYDRLYLSPNGDSRTVRRSESFTKPGGWLLKLATNDDEAKVINYIFDQYVNHDRSARSIVGDLNTRKVASPVCNSGTGTAWTLPELTTILTNPAYIGVGYLGSGRGRKKEKFVSAENLRKAGVCPVIVQPTLFEAAQVKLAKNARTKRKCNKNNSALSGCVVCANCGHRMHQTHWKDRVKFVCNTASLKNGATTCKQWAVSEDELLPTICSHVVRIVDEEILTVIQSKPTEAPLSSLDHLLDQLQAKEKELEKASQRYLTAPDDLQSLLLDSLRKLQGEREELKARFQLQANLTNQAGLKHFVDWWREVRDRLVLTADNKLALDGAPLGIIDARTDEDEYLIIKSDDDEYLTTPDQLRSLLHRLGCEVHCSFAPRGEKTKATPGRGRGPSYVLTGLKLRVNTKEVIVSTGMLSDFIRIHNILIDKELSLLVG